MTTDMQPGIDGLCAAHECPLPGTLGHGNQWVCFCHHAVSVMHWPVVTRTIREHAVVTDTILEVRRYHGTKQWAEVFRAIRQRLLDADKRDLLPSLRDDASPYRPGHAIGVQWQMRLESLLLALCSEAANVDAPTHPAPPPATHAPTHVSAYLPSPSSQAERES